MYHSNLASLTKEAPLLSEEDGRRPLRHSETVPALRRLFADAGIQAPSNQGISFRAGGATRLADMGVPAEVIKARGRLTSDCFERFIRKSLRKLAEQSQGM